MENNAKTERDIMDYTPLFKPGKAFQFGCGRFRQEEHLLEQCAEEVVRVGHSPLLVCTDISAGIALEKIQTSLSGTGIPLRILKHNGYCDLEAAGNYIDQGITSGIDVILGCGGGMILDFAKCMADMTGLPLITIPTSSATCCAYTPLSGCYEKNGKSAGSPKYDWSISAVLADMTILSQQPPRLMMAGICDALSKKIEIEQRLQDHNADSSDAGFALCYELAKYIYNRLDREWETAYQDIQAKTASKTVYDAVYFSIVGAGLISGLANGSRQTAVGHKFYLYVRTAFTQEAAGFLHGELVGIGDVAQLIYNGDPEEAARYQRRLRNMGLPGSMADLRFPVPENTLNDCCDFINGSSAMKGASDEDRERLKKALHFIITERK